MTDIKPSDLACPAYEWTHVKYVQGRNVGCQGRHMTEDERATVGHCMEFCGSDECAVLCDEDKT